MKVNRTWHYRVSEISYAVETEESLVEGEGARNELVNYEAEPSKPEQGNVQWTPPVVMCCVVYRRLSGRC